MFIYLVVASVVGAVVFASIAQANADLCFGGQDNTPEETLEAIMEIKLHRNHFEFKVASFYFRQCSTENPLAFFEEHVEELEAAFLALYCWYCPAGSDVVITPVESRPSFFRSTCPPILSGW